MTIFSASATLSGSSNSVATPSPVANPSSGANFTVAGLNIIQHEAGYYRVAKYLGNEMIPGDIKRLRRSTYEMMRRFGQPVLIKHMFNDADVTSGIAQTSPNWDDIYGQTRMVDPFSFGVG